MTRKIILILLLFNGLPAAAQVHAAKYSNEFLAIGVGGRALAMGNAQVAVAQDATAGYWNPAGLTGQINQYQAVLQHGEYFSGIAQFDYLAFGMQIDSVSNLAFSVIRFGIDDIPDTRFLYDANGAINYDNVRFFTAADYAFITSYARQLPWLGGLSIGGNFKIIHRKAGDFATAWGFGLDVGMMKSIGRWQLGAVFRDVTGTFTAWSHNTEAILDVFTQTGNTIPENSVELTVPRLIVGAGRQFTIKKFGILPTIDLAVTFDGKRNTVIKSNFASIDPALGVEFDYDGIGFLRVGIRNFQQLTDFDGSRSLVAEPTFGVGFRYRQLSVDYALTSAGPATTGIYSHIFSLLISFDSEK